MTMNVVVIVMGDVGRSPRMQYHTLSLLKEGHNVWLVGYEGEAILEELQSFEERFHVVRFSAASGSSFLRKFPILYYIWRLITLVYQLVRALEVPFQQATTTIDAVLVQNPPAIPVLLLAWWRCQLQRYWKGQAAALIIDWHNLGYSMLNGKLFRTVAAQYERTFAKYADGHLCVTSAMKEFLVSNMGLSDNIRVLYDCPPSLFRPLSLSEQHEFLMRQQFCGVPQSWYDPTQQQTTTLLTEQTAKGTVISRRNRPALVTSSTSWTPDEDFGILLDALTRLDERIQREQSTLQVLVMVTGKGPLKEFYEEKMSKLTLFSVAIQTLWLEFTDYPKLLACADLGISLHTSTSNLDLPMKILDLFGCEVPVCAYNFECLSELVQDGVNGRVFETSKQLAEQLYSLLSPIATGKESMLSTYSQKLKDRRRWDENWKENALPVLEEAVQGAIHCR